MNLFLAQGETRMNEIGIRRANGAGISDLIKQFFPEVTFTTLVAFIFGFILAIGFTPYFSQLVERDIDLAQLSNPWFIISAVGVIAIPVAYWFSANWLNNYADRTSLGWLVFVAPMVIQCLIAALVIFGISHRVLSTNPVKYLQSE